LKKIELGEVFRKKARGGKKDRARNHGRIRDPERKQKDVD